MVLDLELWRCKEAKRRHTWGELERRQAWMTRAHIRRARESASLPCASSKVKLALCELARASSLVELALCELDGRARWSSSLAVLSLGQLALPELARVSSLARAQVEVSLQGLISHRASLHRQASHGGWHLSLQSANFPFIVTHFSVFLVYCATLELVLVEKI